MNNIAIIIPTFNELENIENLIREILNKVPESTIFIVDDSKNQEIGELIKIKNIKANYYHRENKSGRGSAVIYGLNKAIKEDKYNYTSFVDKLFQNTRL